MIIRTPGKVYLNNVMWQPAFQCVMGCKDCYVASSESSQSTTLNADILDLIYNQKKVICRQFTISLDSHPKNTNTLLEGWLHLLWYHYDLTERCDCESFTRYQQTLENGEKEQLPELCVTAFNINTVEQWAAALDMPIEDFLKPLTILSISQLPSSDQKRTLLYEACKSTKTILNYNKMVSTDTESSPEALQKASQFVDQIHLVLQKFPLGSSQSPDAIKRWFKARKGIPAEKLFEDQCLQDSVSRLQRGVTCSAGIDKIHVWPDGSVTGCPYDSHHIVTEKVNSVFTEIENAVLNRECHSMKYCDIPSTLQPFIQKSVAEG